MKLVIRRIVMVLVALGIVGLIAYGFMPQPISVDLTPATVGPLRVTVDQEGKTRIKERYLIASPLGGQLQRIDLKPGAEIKAGMDLAVIQPKETEFLDPSALAQAQARVKMHESMRERAEASVRQMKVKLEFAQRDRERLHRLVVERSAPAQELDMALQAERSAAEELRAAQQAVKAAEFELEQSKAVLLRSTKPGTAGEGFPIKSPIDGRVLKVEQESATVIAPGTKLLEIGNPKDLEIVIDVLSADAVKIKPGARMLLEHWGGEQPLEAVVRLIEPAGFTKISALGVEEQRVNVIGDFTGDPETRANVGDNYRVEARIIVWEKSRALKVPAGAMIRQGDHWSVFVVEDGKAKLRTVTAGRSNGLETEIIAGLTEGELVIVHAGDRVKEGTAVRPR